MQLAQRGSQSSNATRVDWETALDKCVPIGRTLFAASLFCLGIEHFIYGEFVTGRAPAWPAAVPGQTLWAWIGGTIVVVTSAAMLAGKAARTAAIVLAVLIFTWALLRHIPVVAAADLLAGEWTRMVKALAFTGGALAVAAVSPEVASSRHSRWLEFVNQNDRFILIGKLCLAAFMINNGLQHFIFTDFVASLIPRWFPGNGVFWAYCSAWLLFAGALGMFHPRTARPAALLTGIMVFSWVWIVHVTQLHVSKSANLAVFEAAAIAGIAFLVAGYRAR